MLHSLKRSRGPVLFLGFLLHVFTTQADPPADIVPPPPEFYASQTVHDPIPAGTVRILAVMVEFQEDDNRLTTGNGTFDLSFLDRSSIIIDPLPHDRGYFEAHLEFAKNYFETVSGGQLAIEYDVLPEVIQLDSTMDTYSPLGETDEENYKLANLARDAWSKAGDMELPDISHYNQNRTMFVIFHAGSGRNLELMGTSLYKTPQDIPSVYLDNESLKRLLDNPSFDGFDIGTSGLRVTNTALLPQTQSRPGEDVTGEEYVLQLSINGLIAANIGSFLGLPDLFNTETGASAIGRFGLMDGASIFSYLGLFPPEPSAWEKIRLGWQQPFDITLDTGNPINLPAGSLRKPNSIARHHLSSDEYFLVENRHRNPSGDPLEITLRTPDGRDVTYTVDPGDERFDPFDDSDYDEILEEPGVLINVSNYDWSLPGGPVNPNDDEENDNGQRILNGGMLIWHIDEAVIRNNLEDNRVNANTDRRGVELMEADGAQDIGRTDGATPDRYTNGHAFDYWWEGNDFTVITTTGERIVFYENRFGPDTRPSSESNTGSPGFFEFYDFSDNRPEAFFHARSLGGTYAQPVSPSFPALPVTAGFAPETALFPVSPVVTDIPIPTNKRTAGTAENQHTGSSRLSEKDWPDNRLLILPTPQGFYSIPMNRNEESYAFMDHPSPTSPLIHTGFLTAGQIRYTGATDRQDVYSWAYNAGEWRRRWVVEDQPAGPGLLSFENGEIIHLDRTYVDIETDGSIISDDGSPPYQRSGEVDGITAYIENERFELSNGSFHYDLAPAQRESQRIYTGNLRFSADSGPSFFILTDDRLDIVDQNEDEDWQMKTLYEGNAVSWPAFGDFTGDQSIDILITDRTGEALHGFNRDGGILDYFPLQAPDGHRFTGTPLLADLTGDGKQEIITAAMDSLSMTIYAFDQSLNKVDGFPLLAGSLTDDTQQVPAPLLIDEGHLFAISPAGEVRGWGLPELGEVGWSRTYGDQRGNKAGINAERQRQERPAFGILNGQETYNWPNPAKDQTNIRYETSEPALIDITIINPGGSTVFNKQTESQGRYPQEIQVNTSSWGSGVYFGRIRADNGQKSESKMIKIVITH